MSRIAAVVLAGCLAIAVGSCASDMQKDEMMKKEEMMKKDKMKQ